MIDFLLACTQGPRTIFKRREVVALLPKKKPPTNLMSRVGEDKRGQIDD